MIRVFQPADTTFNTNGDVVLRPLRAKVRKEDNDNFYLDMGWNKAKGDMIYYPQSEVSL